MVRLTDLIREQSSQDAHSLDVKNSTRSMGLTGLPILPSTPSPSVAEADGYQRACHELQGIKHAVQTRQPWTLDELALIASGMVSSLGADFLAAREAAGRMLLLLGFHISLLP